MAHIVVIPFLIVVLNSMALSQVEQDPLCIGCEAPTFSLQSMDQQYISLRAFCGEELIKPWINKTKHIVVLSFFATWCEPCKKEIPHLEKLQEEFKDQPVKFFLIDVGEGRDKVKEFIDKEDIKIPVLFDRYQKTAERFDALTLPRLFVIDKNGLIQRKQKGFSNPEDFLIEMRELINVLLENDI